MATAIELRQGDLVSDARMCATMDLLFGAPLRPLLSHIAKVISNAQIENAISTESTIATRQLPWVEDAEDRLNMAMGAALTLKSQKQNNIVMAYAYYAELPKRSWKQLLTLTAKLNLPIIFVILPEASCKGEATNICAKARAVGIPGIPVDASDAIALYRVAQESIGRSRGEDGPVLIECISCNAEQRSNEINDPIFYMKKFLTGRNIASKDWVNHVSDSFRKKLAAAKHS